MSNRMSRQKRTFQIRTKANVPTLTPDNLIRERSAKRYGCIPFGSDNLFPYAIAAMNRKSGVHRGILNKKTAYISGHGFQTNNNNLLDWTNAVNANEETLSDVLSKVIYDHLSDGNGYCEVITDGGNTFLNIEHHDHTTVRISEDKSGFVIKANWREKRGDKIYIPKYPYFEQDENGNLHSMIHIKSYEPEFMNYGVMDWIAGLDASAIAYKTNKWNVARLDNSFQTSGVMMIAGEFESEEAALALKDEMEHEYAGEDAQGKVLFIVADLDGKQSKFIPFEQKFEGDWTTLSKEAITDLIVAHSWYRSLTSLGDNTGFDTNRILNEYEMALLDTILPKQRLILRPIKTTIQAILGIDASDLKFVNKYPIKKQLDKFLMIWEARKERGLSYDENDPKQQQYLFEIM